MMTRRRCRWLMVLLGVQLPGMTGIRTAQAQERPPRFLVATTTGFSLLNVERAPALMRRISPSLDEVPLAQALAAISSQSGVRFVFLSQDLPEHKRIRLVADAITVAAALTEVLLGTGMDVVYGRDGRILLTKRTAETVIVTQRQTGMLRGRVTEAMTGTPVGAAQVTIAGTGMTRATDAKGEFAIPGVPAGEREVRVRRLGFMPIARRVQIVDGETAVADFALSKVATTLTEIVTTATGERSRLEVGNSVGTIKADSVVATTLIRNVSDLLTARTPGVVVTNATGQVGSPSTIRIRGLASVSLSNDPIIILDGVRLTPPSNAGGATNIGTSNQPYPTSAFFTPGSSAPARIDDIDPNTIESIDVLRGPSASSLYGTDAAAGVIVIKTKKGKAGSWRSSILADDGQLHIPGTFPKQWIAYGHLPNGTPITNCMWTGPDVTNVLDNTCVQDSVRSYLSPMDDPKLTTLGTGSARNLSASLSGGTEQLREFLSLRLSDAMGVTKLSSVEQDRIVRMWGTEPPPWMRHPNTEQNINGSSRTDIRIGSALDLSLTASGIYRNTLMGAEGTLADANGGGFPAAGLARGLYDTLIYLPAEYMRAKREGIAKRGYGATSASYTPLSWLVLHGTLGGDYTLRTDNGLGLASTCTAVLFPSGCPSGHLNSRGETFVTTFDINAQATWTPKGWLSFRSSIGEQYSHTTFYNLTAQSCGSCTLAFGTDLLTPSPVSTTTGTQLYTVNENRDVSATAGWYLEEVAAIRDRLFLTAAFREDVSSAFGRNVNAKAPVYPKYSMSWVLSDEPFFPRTSFISSLRLRSAYGHSGQEARQSAVLNNFAVVNALPDGAVVPGIVMSGIGNPDLRPERTAELEGGVDLSLLNNERIHIEGTVYRKLSNDAIASRTFGYNMGSAGFNANRPRFTENFNLGKVENRGWELSTTAKVVDARTVTFEMTVNATRNINRLVSSTTATFPTNATSGNFVGYPLQSYFGNTIVGYADVNGDGILSLDEVQVSALPIFLGTTTPESELSYLGRLGLWGGALQINANFDQVNGWTRDLNINNFLSSSVAFRQEQVDRDASIAEQAAVLNAVLNRGFGWRAKTNSLRFSELSATWNVPRRIAAQLLRVQSAAVTFAGRNLALWTTYAGKDPDVASNAGTGSLALDAQVTDYLLTQPRSWTVRINLGY